MLAVQMQQTVQQIQHLSTKSHALKVDKFGSISSGWRIAEWFMALDSKSGGAWFKSFTLPLSGFVLGRPEVDSSTVFCM